MVIKTHKTLESKYYYLNLRIYKSVNVQDSSYKAYYADRVTKKLLRFEYDLDKGELGESTMVADFSNFAGNMT